MGRFLIVGDIHGCLDEFDELLKVADFSPARDLLLPVGDLVDRGPDSIGVIRRCRELKACTVRGNHDQKYIRIREQGTADSDKHSASVKRILRGLSPADWKYIEEMPFSVRLGPKIVVSHAGAEPCTPFDQQDAETLSRVRHVTKEGKFTKGKWDDRPSGGYYWSYGWKGPECIIYGHQVHSLIEPFSTYSELPGTNAWTLGIDTGCCYGGRLTAVILDEKDIYGENMEIVQVDANHVYSSMLVNADYRTPSKQYTLEYSGYVN